MKIEIKLEAGLEFTSKLSNNMIICYDFYNDKYWCKYDTKYGFQFHWLTARQVKNAIQLQNKDFEVVFLQEL